MQHVEECRIRLLESGILDISRSLTNRVDSNANKKRKKKEKKSEERNKDPDYDSDDQLAGEEVQEDEGQSSNQAKSTKKLKNAEQHHDNQDEGSATELVTKPVKERSTMVGKKPVTRSTAPSQKFVPPMMLNKLLKQSKQQRQAKGKALSVAELFLQKKQSEKEAAPKSPTRMVGCSANKLLSDADLQWLSELDERFHVNGDEEDKADEESGNPVNDDEEDKADDESAAEGNGEDPDDLDIDGLDDSNQEDVDDNDAEYDNVNKPSNSQMVMQGATGRGPTMMHAVHMRPIDKSEVVILNEFGQPIGPVTPEKDTAKEFSRFLGTIARDYDNAPLTYKTWRKVPNKDKLWEYVLVGDVEIFPRSG